METQASVTIASQHPAFDGHFPGAPLLPGVVLLDEALRRMPASNGAWSIASAKFLHPVRPGVTLTFEYQTLANGSVRFTIRCGELAVASGTLTPQAVPIEPRAMATKPADLPHGQRGARADWASSPERGSLTLLRMMAGVSLRLGRPVGRLILYPIAVYFFLFAPRARRHSLDYLRTVLGRRPRARDRFRQVFNFAAVILDRLYLVNERYGLFDVTLEGEESMRAALAGGSGAFLMGAHFGSFEITSAVGRRQPGLRVAMAMYEENARKVSAMFKALNPGNSAEIIGLGQIEAMLRIRERLDAGVFVGILGDRSFGREPGLEVQFLGRPAVFPLGPMRAAAVLRRPVYFMLGIYEGGNRYRAVFEKLADFSDTRSGERERAVEASIRRYAARLEEYCRRHPYNWFNFFDFWRLPDAPR